MSVHSAPPVKTSKILLTAMRVSGCMAGVLLYAGAITDWDVLENAYILGFFGWTVVLFIMTAATFITKQTFRPFDHK